MRVCGCVIFTFFFLFLSCWPRLFTPSAARARGSDDGTDVFLFNLLSVCCWACFFFFFEFEATLVTSNPGWTERTETLLSPFLHTRCTSCSLRVPGAPAVGCFRRRVLSVKCCCLFLFFSEMFQLKAQGSCLVHWQHAGIDPGLVSLGVRVVSLCDTTAAPMNPDWLHLSVLVVQL